MKLMPKNTEETFALARKMLIKKSFAAQLDYVNSSVRCYPKQNRCHFSVYLSAGNEVLYLIRLK